MMNERHLEPEWLDHLPPADPAAVRSRADLRRINFLMGNERWILRSLARFPAVVARGIHEWGAGDGALVEKIARKFPHAEITAHDLAPRPRFANEIDGQIDWRQGDLFAAPPSAGGVLVANLFLHHFDDGMLHELGRRCEGHDVLLFNEPDRARLPLMLGALLHPLVNHVTRHDMRVSILAGFRAGEIQWAMGLKAGEWHIGETSTWRGARRVIAWRA
jgi:hypothetical protein